MSRFLKILYLPSFEKKKKKGRSKEETNKWKSEKNIVVGKIQAFSHQ